MYIDFHTHKKVHNQADIIEIISCHNEKKYDTGYFTCGFHPWWSLEQIQQQDLDRIRNMVREKDFLAVGECGLDKLKGGDKEIQEANFINQIHLANQYNVPIIIHCVRQYDQILSIKKKYGNTPWVIHGFRRNKLLAKTLIENGIYLSISPIKHMPESFIEMIKFLPLDMFFIETDSEYSLSIIERYEMVSKMRKVDILNLQNTMIDNINKFFRWKGQTLIG